MRLVVDALVAVTREAKKLVEVPLVMTDEVAKMFCVKVFRNLRVEDPSEKDASTDGVVLPAICRRSVGLTTPTPILPFEETLNQFEPEDEATVKILPVSPAVPLTANLDEGVDDPTPTFPFWRIVKSCVPVDDATENGFTPARPCTLNDTVDDVALIPATVPLSIRVEVPRVVAVNQRVANPAAPPVIVDAEIPSDDVATQRVDVPTDWRIIPRVPVALVASAIAPRKVKRDVEVALVKNAFVALRAVDDAFPSTV